MPLPADRMVESGARSGPDPRALLASVFAHVTVPVAAIILSQALPASPPTSSAIPVEMVFEPAPNVAPPATPVAAIEQPRDPIEQPNPDIDVTGPPPRTANSPPTGSSLIEGPAVPLPPALAGAEPPPAPLAVSPPPWPATPDTPSRPAPDSSIPHPPEVTAAARDDALPPPIAERQPAPPSAPDRQAARRAEHASPDAARMPTRARPHMPRGHPETPPVFGNGVPVSPTAALTASPPMAIPARPAATAPANTGPMQIVAPRFRAPPRPPVYPRSARDQGQQGEVVVRAILDVAGNPAEVRLVRSSGFETLDQAALAAVRVWSFEPGRRGDVAVIAWVQIPVRFTLH